MTRNGWFVFGSFDTRALGVTVVPGDLEQAPAREFQVIPTPGRNGDILVDNQKYPNVERTYWVMIRSNFATVYRQLRSALLSVTGYARLTDTWNQDEFYDAYVSAELQPTISRNRDQGTVLVTFSRKPQRFLTSGEEPITLTSGEYITNPTPFDTRPLLHLDIVSRSYDTGAYKFCTIRDYDIYINFTGHADLLDAATYVEIDMALRKAITDGATQDITAFLVIKKGNVQVNDLPALAPGPNWIARNLVTVSSSYIIPRWYTV